MAAVGEASGLGHQAASSGRGQGTEQRGGKTAQAHLQGADATVRHLQHHRGISHHKCILQERRRQCRAGRVTVQPLLWVGAGGGDGGSRREDLPAHTDRHTCTTTASCSETVAVWMRPLLTYVRQLGACRQAGRGGGQAGGQAAERLGVGWAETQPVI